MSIAAHRRGLLYRRGFVCLDASETPSRSFLDLIAQLGWRVEEVAGLRLWTHPETEVASYALPDATLVVLGSAFVLHEPSVADRIARMERASDAALADLAEALCGRYAILVVGSFGARVYNDPFGSRSIYYRASGGLAVGSHAVLLAEAVGAPPSAEMADYIKRPSFHSRGVRYLPGDHTLHEGIHALIPNNFVQSDLPRTRRYWPRAPRAAVEMDTFLGMADTYLQRLVAFVSSRWTPVFGLTGGINTRTLVAAFRALGVPFETVTWERTGRGERERRYVENLVELIGAPHRFLNIDVELTRVARIAGINSGGFRGRARPPQVMHKVFGARSDVAFVSGWGGEVLRGLYNLNPNRIQDLFVGEMARIYLRRLDRPDEDRAFWDLTCAAFSEFRERGNYPDVDDLGYDPNDIFYLEHRMGMWCGSAANEFDPAMAHIVGFNSRPLYRAAWGVSPETRLTKHFLMRVANHFDPALAGVSFLGRDKAAEVGAGQR